MCCSCLPFYLIRIKLEVCVVFVLQEGVEPVYTELVRSSEEEKGMGKGRLGSNMPLLH